MPTELSLKIALVHDYFTQLGGAEKVAEALYSFLPNARLFATVALPDKMPDALRHVPVETSWMQRLPRLDRYYRLYFPLYPFAVSSLDLSGYDLVVSSSSGYVKGVQTNLNAIHVCYCHTPMRWAWSFDSYSSRESFGGGLRTVLPAFIQGLRRWDEGAARQPDHFVANSQAVADRIQRVYGRSSEVIVPPIDIERFKPSTEQQEDYYLVLARIVSYKRLDLAVSAFSRLGKRLVVIGRPTIAFKAGGAVETVVEGVTGVFFEEQTTESLMDAVRRFERQEWDAKVIRQHAEGFGTDVFRDRFTDFLRRIGAPIHASEGE